MSTPAPVNRQARATVGILNTIRIVGTIAYVAIAGLAALGTLIGVFSSDSPVEFLLIGLVSVVVALIGAAVFYAIIGWFVDTLALLTQIAKNTAPEDSAFPS